MASLRDIRSRINSVQNTKQVTRAMKMVAAAKLRRAQERIFRTRPYAYKLRELITHLKVHLDPAEHTLFAPREEVQGVLVIVVTADRGLAGAFNANAIKRAEEAIAEHYPRKRETGDLHVLAVGRKGYEHFARRGYEMVGDLQGIFDDLSFDHAREAAHLALDGYTEGRWDEVRLVYNEFQNTISQNRIAEPFLPIPEEQFVTPVMEEEIDHQAAFEGDGEIDYIFEPNAGFILESLIPRYLNYQLWRIMLESNAAEQGARMVAMDNATTNAEELIDDLKLQYNRARQDAITTEIIEIVSGAEALGAS